LRSASAGVAAATVWALQEPIDQRLLKQPFSQFVQSQEEFDLWFKQRVLASACVDRSSS
jgi:hypothetical protein